MANEKRARGRPAKAPEQRRRNNLTMRVRDETKAALEAVAAANQRSLSEEAEVRLEQSFRHEQTLAAAMDDAFSDGRTLALFRIFAAIADQEKGDHHWLDDYPAFNAVAARWRETLAERRPPAPAEYLDRIERLREFTRDIKNPDLPVDMRKRMVEVLLLVAGSDTTMPEEIRREFAVAVKDVI